MAANYPRISASDRNLHLAVLNVSSYRRLGLFLNIRSSGHEVNDFQGLAEKIGFEYMEILNFEQDPDPTKRVIREWVQRGDLNPTIGQLFDYLEEMERIDVITECYPLILKDIETFSKKRGLNFSPLQDQTVSQSTMAANNYKIIDDHTVDETQIMTVEDVEHGSPQLYDAFVCYCPEGEDIKFVKMMISILESEPYNLKLFVPGRNDLPGAASHTVSASLIENRCRRMVIIISHTYLKSPACDFQTKFAFCLSPGARSKKLVPVLIEPCTIPSILRHITMCDYTKKDLQEWIWRRLVESIRAPLNAIEWQERHIESSDITLTISSSYDDLFSSSPNASSTSISTSPAQMSRLSQQSPSSSNKKSKAHTWSHSTAC
ncbi:hypothetical protein LOTGIDRAFT_203449 [Lottia gigantea]|uniref:Myeloid differentiation primary response protein MyD88 n=1 Tax=Lottia gigantea TaxID=225164 RepID=V4B650_LOTGI|nr:hypothetical protein LOTGIDRAFT_203449 [Lottia gigantea]ESP03006.1 hypothetical protein LOTGIDRAFT_203449 [Lottia gigantea]